MSRRQTSIEAIRGNLTIKPHLWLALQNRAAAEDRSPADMVRVLIREGLERRGIRPAADTRAFNKADV
jgi:hypothetical protein